MAQTYPTLYKDGRQWEVWVESIKPSLSIIFRRYGKIDGKLTTTERKVTEGKNTGKANETNTWEQACKEALSYWKKQKEIQKFSKDNNQTINQLFTPSPMLAKTYDINKPSKIEFPCYIQPKLDGVRLLVYIENGETKLVSRTGKNLDNPNLINIKASCESLLKENPSLKCLDGELYTKELCFEEIVSLCRNKSKKDESKKLEYHIYDIITNGPFSSRYNQLKQCSFGYGLYQVFTEVCNTSENIKHLHNLFTKKQGYEGIMLRNMNGVYKGKRSDDLQKFKTFIDEEFEIISVKEGLGRDEHTAIFECLNLNNSMTFWVRPTGTFEYRKKLLDDSKNIIGKSLTVVFQEYTDQGVPRFPVGKCIRDYE